MENKFRAVRYGLEGKLIDFGKEEEVPECDLILEYLNFVDEVVDELGCRSAIEHIRPEMIREGSGADRQLRSVARDRRSERRSWTIWRKKDESRGCSRAGIKKGTGIRD